MNIGVRRDYVGGEEMETQLVDFIEVSDATIGNHAEAAQSPVNIGVYLTP